MGIIYSKVHRPRRARANSEVIVAPAVCVSAASNKTAGETTTIQSPC
jgi:hypothetical protein